MKLSLRPFQRYQSPALTSTLLHTRHISSVPATAANRSRLTPEQLQYGRPNTPTPPSTHKRLDQIHANIPSYPHRRKYWYKKANLGLYGHLSIRHGNVVSSQNEHKNPRIWKVNVQHKRLWSECLERFIRVKIATRIIRTVDKVGGLDNYLLGNRKGRIRELGMAGWALRWRVLRTPKGRERASKERRELGLTDEPTWMGLPFASKWLAAHEAKMGLKEAAGQAEGVSTAGSEKSSLPVTANVGDIGIDASPAETLLASSADEAAAMLLEREIDSELDMDEQAALRGEDGGIVLDVVEEEEVKKK